MRDFVYLLSAFGNTQPLLLFFAVE
uniref:Uncharacterized protein n=1 Tax=Rhizophora mucronata TaxID=61149 RepID=A0A2P2NV54_RHIMU